MFNTRIRRFLFVVCLAWVVFITGWVLFVGVVDLSDPGFYATLLLFGFPPLLIYVAILWIMGPATKTKDSTKPPEVVKGWLFPLMLFLVVLVILFMGWAINR